MRSANNLLVPVFSIDPTMAENSGKRLISDAEDTSNKQENNGGQDNLKEAPAEAVYDTNYYGEHESVTSNLSSNTSVFEQQQQPQPPPLQQPMMMPPHPTGMIAGPPMMPYATYPTMDPNFSPNMMMPGMYHPPPPPPNIPPGPPRRWKSATRGTVGSSNGRKSASSGQERGGWDPDGGSSGRGQKPGGRGPPG